MVTGQVDGVGGYDDGASRNCDGDGHSVGYHEGHKLTTLGK